MIDRKLLQDMGFVEGTGWQYEVWVYKGMFWVHYVDISFAESTSNQICGYTTTRPDFFKKFIEALEDQCEERHAYDHYTADEL